MEYRTLGRSGLKVSPLCIGTLNFGNPTTEADSHAMIERALEAGVNFFDTANYYNDCEAERIIGRWIAASGRRREIVLATKVFFPVGAGPNDRGLSRRHIIAACDDSLRRLQTDYIDLYQLHRPDPETPIEETLATLGDLVRAGKVRYVGCSTFPAWQVMEALALAERSGAPRFISEQPPYNLLDRRIENELVPLALKHGLGLIPWAPLAQGVLAGRYADASAFPADSRAARRGGVYAERVTERGVAAARSFAELARSAGFTPARLALLWVKEQPGVVAPIVGPRTAAQLEDAQAVRDLALTDDLRAACDEIVPPGSALVNFFNSADWMRQQLL